MTNFSTLYLPLLLLFILNSLNAAQNSIENNSQANDVSLSGLFEEKFIANPAEDCGNATTPKISSTTEAPIPPVVERIEVRLVEGENTTQETPLIIYFWVDVVKKNGSGVAATIQQQHESLDAKEPKPSLGFLVRLKQPNYHSVSYIPYEAATTSSSTTTEVPQAEEHVTESTESPATTTAITMEGEEEKEEEQPAISTTPNSINSSQTDEEAEGIGEMIQFVSIGKIEEEKVLKENKAEEKMEEFDGKEKEEEEDGGAPPSSEEEQPEHDEEGEGEEEEAIFMESVEELNGTNLGDGQELEDMGGKSQQNFSEFGDEPHGEEGEGFGPFGDDRAEEMAERDESSEECLANRANLAKEAVKRLVAERRRIVQAIKKMNKHQMLLCRPDREQNQVPYRKCPMWRREKFFLYYALMRITYCDNHARWPGGRRFRAV